MSVTDSTKKPTILDVDDLSPTLPLVFDAMVLAFDGRPLSYGRRLKASSEMPKIESVSDAVLPFLSLQTGTMTIDDESDEEAIFAVSALGVLKVKAQGTLTAGKMLRATLQDLATICWAVRGLYVDEKSKKLLSWFERDDFANRGCSKMEGLVSLANYGGPVIRSVRTIEVPGWPYAIAEIGISLRFKSRLEWAEYNQAHVIILGMRTGTELSDAQADFIYSGRSIDTPESGIGADGEPLASTPLSAQLHRVAPVPQAFSLATAATKQLAGLGFYADGSTANFTTTGTWQTSAAGVATVSSSGLVTGVSAGTATITLTANGVAGTATVTVT